MRENNVIPSNVMEFKMTSPNKSKWHHSSPCSDLLQNNSLQFPLPLQASSVRIVNNLKKVDDDELFILYT